MLVSDHTPRFGIGSYISLAGLVKFAALIHSSIDGGLVIADSSTCLGAGLTRCEGGRVE
jgi:hypothetical protein